MELKVGEKVEVVPSKTKINEENDPTNNILTMSS